MRLLLRTIASIAITATAALGAASCANAPAYVNVPAGQSAAEMRFVRSFGDPGFGGGANQSYSVSTDENCSSARDAGSFSWATGSEKILRMTPDQPTLIWGYTVYYLPNGMSFVNGTPVSNLSHDGCRSVVRFTPERDHAYDVRQPTAPRSPGCALEIIDRSTGKPAAAVEVLKLDACIEAGKAPKN